MNQDMTDTDATGIEGDPLARASHPDDVDQQQNVGVPLIHADATTSGPISTSADDTDSMRAPTPPPADPGAASNQTEADEAPLVADETVTAPVSARQAQKAATRATKEALITQAGLVAMMSPAKTAPDEMKALMAQWRKAGRITKTEDDALWARFNAAQDQLFTRLNLLRQQRRDEMAEAKRVKDSLIATAEEVAQRADVRQAAETMAALMAQWKQVGPAPDDKSLWLRFKAAQDEVYQRRHEQRRASQSEQHDAAETKRALIAEVEGLIGSPDLRDATDRLRDIQSAFREAGYAGRDLNRRLAEQLHTAQQDFYRWMRHEPARRRDSGEQPTYGRRTRLVRQIAQTKADIDRAEEALRTIDSSGAKRSHGSAITLTIRQAGAYSSAAADAMRLKIRLTDLESQLARLDSTLKQPSHTEPSEPGSPEAELVSSEPESSPSEDPA